MPALLDRPCHACRGRHVLCCEPGESLTAGRVYVFVCPAAGTEVWFTADDVFARVVCGAVSDAVIIRPVRRAGWAGVTTEAG